PPSHDAQSGPGEWPESSGPEVTVAELRPPLRRVSGRAVGMWTLRLLFSVAFNLIVVSVLALGLANMPWGWIPEPLRENASLLPVVYGAYALLKVAIVPSWRSRAHRWEGTGDVIHTRAGWIHRAWPPVPGNGLTPAHHRQGRP